MINQNEDHAKIIDVFAHTLPTQLKQKVLAVAPDAMAPWMRQPLLNDIAADKDSILPGHAEILSAVNLNPEDYMAPNEAADVTRQANEALISICQQYPQQFAGSVAMVPMNNVPEALKIIDDDVDHGPMLGIQLFTRALKKPITATEFQPIFQKMADIDAPIWLHPIFDETKTDNNITFSWEYEQTLAMNNIVNAQYFSQYPNLKVIVHHAGAMVPYFAERIRYIQGEANYQAFKKFYVDTAILGNPNALALAIAFFGTDHVLFGTDAPLGVPPIGASQVIEDAINALPLSESDREKIFKTNFVQLH